jgi:hypothetical protein
MICRAEEAVRDCIVIITGGSAIDLDQIAVVCFSCGFDLGQFFLCLLQLAA